ncbi:sensor domain-containing diguanylate cyclase [Lacisediminimonas profundi]|uniref:sensor domain-containing diguanylate cyclase n=1 Tax=Lacisediminimonas profundi TaxID=2603856 RepID=UPI001386A848|nr:sensor domain-containing diguanylate cyclase [Lacisediminimonas profundi]
MPRREQSRARACTRRPVKLVAEYLSRLCAATVLVIGVLVLSGWLLDVPRPQHVFSGLAAMKANTAACFILAGIALWTGSILAAAHGRARAFLRVLSLACSTGVLMVGFLTSVEYLAGIDFGIDQLMAQDRTSLPGDIPGRMAANTAVNFIASGAALLLLAQARRDFTWLLHGFVLVPFLIAGTALLGYIYNVEAFYRLRLDFTPISVDAVVAFLLLGLGIMNARPHFPLRRTFWSDSDAGAAARLLLPATIGIPLLSGWLALRGMELDLYSATVGMAFVTMANIVALTALVQWSAMKLLRSEQRRRLAESSLQASEERYRTVVAALFDGVVLMNADGTIKASNSSAQRILGLSMDELAGKTSYDPHWQAIHEDGSPFPGEQHPATMTLKTGESLSGVIMGLQKPGGVICWISINSQPLYKPGQSRPHAVVTSFADITDRKRAEDALKELQARLREEAIRDPLTGLFNRRYLEETLSRELSRAAREGHPVSVLMMDIDHFKKLNDTYGHQAGDDVLRAIGTMLLQHARRSDIPCRYGGEEFLVVLPHMTRDAARERADHVREDFARQAIDAQGQQVRSTICIGVAAYPADGETAEQLIAAADRALYCAKHTGRNRVCVAIDGAEKAASGTA